MRIRSAIKHFVLGDDSWWEWQDFIRSVVDFLMNSYTSYRDRSPFIDSMEDIMQELVDEELHDNLYDYAFTAYPKLQSSEQTDLISSLTKRIKHSFRYCQELTIRDLDFGRVILEEPEDVEIVGLLHGEGSTTPIVRIDTKELAEFLSQWGLKSNIEKHPRIKRSPLQVLDVVDINLYKLIVNEPELLRSLDWRTFELLLADILRTVGYNIELTRATKDGGIDLFAIKQDSEFGVHKYLLQAKRYKEKVQVEPVRSLLFLHNHYKATKSCLATTAQFTKGAWQLADNYKWQLELKDYTGIYQWVKHVLELKQRQRA